jgi:hypothetical protein
MREIPNFEENEFSESTRFNVEDLGELDDPDYNDVDQKLRNLLLWTINTSE